MSAAQKRQAYGAPLAVERRRGREVARMPWPRPCAVCGLPARIELDGRRLCRRDLREELP